MSSRVLVHPRTTFAPTRRESVHLALLLLLQVVALFRVGAQAPSDSVGSAAAGVHDGRTSGARRGAAGWFVAGVLPGFAVGVGGLFALGETDDPPAFGLYVGAPVLLTTIVAARRSHVDVPDAAAERWRPRHPAADSSAYRRAFDDAYAASLRRKRARRVGQGGVAGVLLGAAALVGLIIAVLPET